MDNVTILSQWYFEGSNPSGVAIWIVSIVGLMRLSVEQKIMGSNPIRSAIFSGDVSSVGKSVWLKPRRSVARTHHIPPIGRVTLKVKALTANQLIVTNGNGFQLSTLPPLYFLLLHVILYVNTNNITIW